MGKTLVEMTIEIRENNQVKGWREDGRTFLEAMALLHSEVSEAVEAWRLDGLADATHSEKPEGVGSELADVLIRVIDTADRFGIDLEAEYERKMAYNRTRPYRHWGEAL